MSEYKSDKRTELKRKSPKDCIKYFSLLVKTLEKSNSRLLKKAKDIAHELSLLSEEEVKRISILSLEQIENCSSDNVATLVKRVNDLRHGMSNSDWKKWGEQIRNQRYKAKSKALSLEPRSKFDIHNFFVQNRVYLLSYFEEEVKKAEHVVKLNEQVSFKSFNELIETNAIPTENYYDDTQALILLDLAKKFISEKSLNDDIAEKLIRIERENLELRSKIAELTKMINAVSDSFNEKFVAVKDRVLITERTERKSVRTLLDECLYIVNR
ncbi:hypothetical protein [Shewanella halifaxensis]|uniref:hypothetical protein n=1 Tax=Shewanella halifaxensis TaxID=271098 RepID=UPI000D59255B|nr:hypothetical protein [Shewanella halifaxensis]